MGRAQKAIGRLVKGIGTPQRYRAVRGRWAAQKRAAIILRWVSCSDADRQFASRLAVIQGARSCLASGVLGCGSHLAGVEEPSLFEDVVEQFHVTLSRVHAVPNHRQTTVRSF
jgi:hypothetical protein